MNLQHNDSGK